MGLLRPSGNGARPKRGQKPAGESRKAEDKFRLRELLHPSGFFQKGIRRRWMVNSVGVVLSIAIAIVIFATMWISDYYYSSMRLGLEARAQAASDFFSSYASTETEYLEMANYYISAFDERDQLELQFINSQQRRVILSSFASYGLSSGGSVMTADVITAIEEQTTGYWMGRDPNTGERVMAVSSPIVNNGQVRGVMRLVTSLSRVDRQIVYIVCLVMLGGAFVVILMYGASVYFIKSIVEPMATRDLVSRHIAAGSYGIQIEKQYDDEIGQLTDAINDMSLKISQNERMKSEFISSVSTSCARR